MEIESSPLSPKGQKLKDLLIRRARQYAEKHSRPDLTLAKLMPGIANKLSHVMFAASGQEGSEATFKIYDLEGHFETPQALSAALIEVADALKKEFPDTDWDQYVQL